jgi:predicted 3-demethylubiquinone-9 3-methyltransferase (glyoxalase superfamily)
MTKSIYNCLWFDNQAKEAAAFYCSIFKAGKIISENPMVVNFEINGTRFMGLNGGQKFKPNEAVSMVIECDNQTEIDHYWTSLTGNGGAESQCGWVKDKFGFSWQIIPANLGALMANPNAMAALLKMKKIEISVLESA